MYLSGLSFRLCHYEREVCHSVEAPRKDVEKPQNVIRPRPKLLSMNAMTIRFISPTTMVKWRELTGKSVTCATSRVFVMIVMF